MADKENDRDRLISLKEVISQTGMGKDFIYRKIKNGDFPGVVKMGRYSRWSENEVQEWIQERKAARSAA
ncbi:helix-turn-helix transcriptional regulator [Pseudomonas nitroreducens]|uniref:helix-turn-helix transcriptional regulator n=1 Tax=Pseudomonas nitroreducens TaxID=46680 RepID=UPI003D2ACAF6